MSEIRLHVNLSPRELSQPNIAQLVKSALQDAGLEPSTLVLEITERCLPGDAEANVETLRRLRALRPNRPRRLRVG